MQKVPLPASLLSGTIIESLTLKIIPQKHFKDKRKQPTCNSGNANASKDAISTLYFPTLGHLRDSGLQLQNTLQLQMENMTKNPFGSDLIFIQTLLVCSTSQK